MSVDAQRLMDLTTYIHSLWSSPVQIIIAVFFLYEAMGVSILAGVAVMVLLIPVNTILSRVARKLQVYALKTGWVRIVSCLSTVCWPFKLAISYPSVSQLTANTYRWDHKVQDYHSSQIMSSCKCPIILLLVKDKCYFFFTFYHLICLPLTLEVKQTSNRFMAVIPPPPPP